MNNDLKEWVIPVSIGSGALYAGYKIMQKLGIIEDEKDEQNTSLFDPNGMFSPMYWHNHLPALLLTSESANILVEKLWDAVGPFNDNEEAIYGVFQLMKTKTQISFLAERFQINKNISLVFYLRNHLSDSELNNIYNIVKSLPVSQK